MQRLNDLLYSVAPESTIIVYSRTPGVFNERGLGARTWLDDRRFIVEADFLSGRGSDFCAGSGADSDVFRVAEC